MASDRETEANDQVAISPALPFFESRSALIIPLAITPIPVPQETFHDRVCPLADASTRFQVESPKIETLLVRGSCQCGVLSVHSNLVGQTKAETLLILRLCCNQAR